LQSSAIKSSDSLSDPSVTAEGIGLEWPRLDASRKARLLELEEDGLVVTSRPLLMEEDESEIEYSETKLYRTVSATVIYDATKGPELTGNYFEVEILQSSQTTISIGLGVYDFESDVNHVDYFVGSSNSYG